MLVFSRFFTRNSFNFLVYNNLQPLPDSNARNLTSRLAIAKKIFSTWPSPLFLLHTHEIVKTVV